MKDYTDDIELIEKFLGGVMSEEEKSRFENRRASDKEFNAMLKDMDLLVEGIKGSAGKSTKEEKLERLGFHSEIMRMEDDAQAEEKGTRVIPLYRRPQVLALAAAIALLITLVPFYYEGPSNDKLFTTYFEPFDSPGSGTERGTNTISDKGKAYEAYDNGRYEEALSLFEDLLKKKPDDPIIHLCLGNAQLQLGQLDNAEKSFNHVLTKHEDLVTPAKWYLALTYLKQNKMERAKSTLWEISKSSTYGEKAQKLLKDLD